MGLIWPTSLARQTLSPRPRVPRPGQRFGRFRLRSSARRYGGGRRALDVPRWSADQSTLTSGGPYWTATGIATAIGLVLGCSWRVGSMSTACSAVRPGSSTTAFKKAHERLRPDRRRLLRNVARRVGASSSTAGCSTMTCLGFQPLRRPGLHPVAGHAVYLLMPNVQLTDSTALGRTQECMNKVERIAKTLPAFATARAMAGQSMLGSCCATPEFRLDVPDPRPVRRPSWRGGARVREASTTRRSRRPVKPARRRDGLDRGRGRRDGRMPETFIAVTSAAIRRSAIAVALRKRYVKQYEIKVGEVLRSLAEEGDHCNSKEEEAIAAIAWTIITSRCDAIQQSSCAGLHQGRGPRGDDHRRSATAAGVLRRRPRTAASS